MRPVGRRGDMSGLNEARHGPIKAGTVPLDREAEAPWIQDQLSWRSEARKGHSASGARGCGWAGLRGIVRFCSVPGSRHTLLVWDTPEVPEQID